MADAITEPNSRPAAACPPLDVGDVLGADQYWARYAASPPGIVAERINRKVYLMSPLKAASHGDPHALLSLWLGTYASEMGGLIVSDNPTLRLNEDNDPPPDLCMMFPGLRLDPDALRQHDSRRFLRALGQGLHPTREKL